MISKQETKAEDQVQEEEKYLYDEIDLEFFINCRSQHKNHKLFLFRDWENTLRRLFMNKSKNMILSELQMIESEKQSKFQKD